MSKLKGAAERKATASDVAARAGVSKWTVSRAFTPGASISEQSKQQVLQAAEELGYKPNLLARSLSKKTSNIIGLVVDNFENPHKLMMLDEVTTQLQKLGKTAMMLNISQGDSCAQVLAQADQFQVDGLIFLGTVITEPLLQLALEIQHIPLVVVGRSSDIADISVISTDDEAAGAEIASLLLGQGYRRFGYMAGPAANSTWVARCEGYRQQLQRQGCDIQVQLSANCYRRGVAFEVMEHYLQQGAQPVEAIFCENDILALGAMEAIAAHGSDIAVVGFDDIELASSSSVALTSYRQPLGQMMQRALALIERGAGPVTEQIAGELIQRRSHLRRV